MKVSTPTRVKRAIGAFVVLAFATGVSAQTAIEIGLNAQTQSLGLLGVTSKAHVDTSHASGNETDHESWPSAQHISLSGIRLFDIESLSASTHACASCGEVDAHIVTPRLALMGNLVQIESLSDDYVFNLDTLDTTGIFTARVTVPGSIPVEIIRHIPFIEGDTPSGTSLAVNGMVHRQVVNLPGTTITVSVPFHGTLTIGDATGSIDTPRPGELAHDVPLSLTGRLDGALLSPALDVDIALGDIHVYPDGTAGL